MKLSTELTLATHSSLQELASIAFPVRPANEGQLAVIDVCIGTRQVYVQADWPLDGWRVITCTDTRFEIDPATTGEQLAGALSDPAVIEAMDSLSNPPPLRQLPRAKQAKLTGYESLHMGTNRVIACLNRHITVLSTARPVDPNAELAEPASNQLAFI